MAGAQRHRDHERVFARERRHEKRRWPRSCRWVRHSGASRQKLVDTVDGVIGDPLRDMAQIEFSIGRVGGGSVCCTQTCSVAFLRLDPRDLSLVSISVSRDDDRESSPGLQALPWIPAGRKNTRKSAAWHQRPSSGHPRLPSTMLDENRRYH